MVLLPYYGVEVFLDGGSLLILLITGIGGPTLDALGFLCYLCWTKPLSRTCKMDRENKLDLNHPFYLLLMYYWIDLVMRSMMWDKSPAILHHLLTSLTLFDSHRLHLLFLLEHQDSTQWITKFLQISQFKQHPQVNSYSNNLSHGFHSMTFRLSFLV